MLFLCFTHRSNATGSCSFPVSLAENLAQPNHPNPSVQGPLLGPEG